MLKDLPPKSTLHGYLMLWTWDRTLRRLHPALFVQVREGVGRKVIWSAPKVWAVRLAQRRGAKRAKVALARKLGVVVHRMCPMGPASASAPRTPSPLPDPSRRRHSPAPIRRVPKGAAVAVKPSDTFGSAPATPLSRSASPSRRPPCVTAPARITDRSMPPQGAPYPCSPPPNDRRGSGRRCRAG